MVETHAPSDDRRPDPALIADPPQLFEGDPERVGSTPRKRTIWPIVLLLLAVAGAATFHFWSRGITPPAVAPSAESAPQAPAPSPAAESPATRYPIENAGPQAEQMPLPPLQESDPALLDGIAGIVPGEAIDKILRREDIVRRIVATVDNLPRHTVATRLLPLKPAPGRFVIDGGGERLSISAENAGRYLPYVRVADAVDAKTLAALYIRFYPLFQQAYRELGYPDGNFNDRLVEAIDDALAAPVVQGTVRLVQPKVLYEYADPDLERRSAGQKIMMRMGSDNAARIKAKLAQFRREVVGAHVKQ